MHIAYIIHINLSRKSSCLLVKNVYDDDDDDDNAGSVNLGVYRWEILFYFIYNLIVIL